MKMLKCIIFISCLCFISTSLAIAQDDGSNRSSHTSIIDDRNSSNSWKLIRAGPVGYEYQTEEHNGSIISISASKSNEYLVTCAMDGTVNFYRVLMYPNLYPHWPHLYYGKLHVELVNGEKINSCLLTPDQTQLLITTTSPSETRLVTYNLYKLNNNLVDINNAFFHKEKKQSMKFIEEISSFHIVHPRDEYSELWVETGSNRSRVPQLDPYLKKNDKKYQYNSFQPITATTTNGRFQMSISDDSQHMSLLTPSKLLIQSKVENQTRTSELLLGEESLYSVGFLPNSRIVVGIINRASDSKNNNDIFKIWKYSNDEKSWKSDDKEISLKNLVTKPGTITRFVIGQIGSCDRYTDVEKNNSAIVALSTTLETQLYELKMVNDKYLVTLTQVLNASGLNENSMSFSPDGELFSFVESDQKQNMQIWKKQSDGLYKRESNINLTDGKDLRVTWFNLKYYYLLVSQGSNLLIYTNYGGTNSVQVPNCDDKARTQSFYLPAIKSKNENEPKNIEFDGLFHLPIFWYITFGFVIFYASSGYASLLENKVANKISSYLDANSPTKKWVFLLPSLVFYGGVVAMLSFSIFEVIFQTDFINDWPAHLHHVEQWIYENTTDYSQMMHYHGPCTYPAGFMYLYSALYYLTMKGSLHIFQLWWAVFESLQYLLVYAIVVKEMKYPRFLAILVVLSNRLHLYNVRVVINDLPPLLLMYLVVYLAIKKRYFWGSVIYSFVVANKLNFVFYSPAMFLALMSDLGLVKTVLYIILMGVVHIALGGKFLLVNPVNYITIAYDLKRTLLWDKTRSFKFVGRIIYEEKWFHLGLLALSALLVLVYFVRYYRTYQSRGSTFFSTDSIARKRMIGHAFFFINFLFIAFARGLYTPFMCWYFYSFPVLSFSSGFGYSYTLIFWLLHEILFRFFGNMQLEMIATYVWLLTNVAVVVKGFTDWNAKFDVSERQALNSEKKKI